MSEKTTNLFDDIDWETSFTPVFSSTQEIPSSKRNTDQTAVNSNETLKHGSELIPPTIRKFCDESFAKSKVKGSNSNKVIKRVFPGPAGLLPDRMETNKSISELSSEDHVDEADDDVLLCSQRTVSEFEEGPWKEMIKDYFAPNREQLYEKFNISWIKKNSKVKKMVCNSKAPFLASVIHTIEEMEGKIPTVNLILKDSTGVISGTILHSLYKEYAAHLTVGSVIVLKQFGILSVGDSYCVTITPSNLLTIYHLRVSKKSSCAATQRQSTVKKIVLQDMCVEEFWKNYNKGVDEALGQQNTVNLRKIYENSENLRHKLFKPILDSSSRSFVPHSLINGLKRPVVPETEGSTKIMKLNTTIKVPCETNNINIASSVDCNSKKRFDFKGQNVTDGTVSASKSKTLGRQDSDNITISCSQILVQTDKNHIDIWKNLFEEIDADSLFDEF